MNIGLAARLVEQLGILLCPGATARPGVFARHMGLVPPPPRKPYLGPAGTLALAGSCALAPSSAAFGARQAGKKLREFSLAWPV